MRAFGSFLLAFGITLILFPIPATLLCNSIVNHLETVVSSKKVTSDFPRELLELEELERLSSPGDFSIATDSDKNVTIFFDPVYSVKGQFHVTTATCTVNGQPPIELVDSPNPPWGDTIYLTGTQGLVQERSTPNLSVNLSGRLSHLTNANIHRFSKCELDVVFLYPRTASLGGFENARGTGSHAFRLFPATSNELKRAREFKEYEKIKRSSETFKRRGYGLPVLLMVVGFLVSNRGSRVLRSREKIT